MKGSVKMKKTKIVLALMSVLMVLSLAVIQPFAESAVPSPTYTVEADFEKIEFVSGEPYMLDGAIAVRNYGTVLGLGNLNFGYFEKVEIKYCSDGSAMSGDAGSAFCFTDSTVPVWNINDPQILAYGNMTNAQGAWRDDVRACSIDLSNVDYEGDTYLSIFMPDGNGVDILSITFTVKAYTQDQVDELLSQYIKPGNGIYTDCKVYASVNYTLSIASEGGAYNSYDRVWYYNAPYEELAGGISFKPWYQSMKNELFGDLTNADEGYINNIILYVRLKDPTNIYSLDLYSNTTSLYGINNAVNFLTDEYLSRDVVYDTQGNYTHYVLKSYPGLPDNINVVEIQFQLTKSASADFDALFLTNDFSVFTDSLLFEKYAEAYNNGLSAGKEIQRREQEVEVNKAFREGLKEGDTTGYKRGFDEAEKLKDAEYLPQLEAQFNQGVEEGQQEGFIRGYNRGITENSNNVTGQMNNLFHGLFNSISSFLLNFINFEFLGVNLFQLACSVFTIFLFVFFLKLVLPLIGKM